MGETSYADWWRVGTAEDIDKLARRQVRVTKEHNEECKKLLALMGIPVVTVSLSVQALFTVDGRSGAGGS